MVEVAENNIQIEENVWNYPRYWHGYLVFLKPVMTVFNIAHIRDLNFFLQFFLTVTALILMCKKLNLYNAYIFALVLAIINPITAALDLQISEVFYITIIAVIFILIENEFLTRDANILYFFLIIGIVTAYLDFLTYPLVTFGIPLCVYIFVNKEKFFSALPLKILTIYLFSWSFGYFGMWAGKWIVASILTDTNVIADALDSAMYRTSFASKETIETDFTVVEMFSGVIGTFFRGSAGIFAALIILYILYSMLKNRKNIAVNRNKLSTLTFIVALPFLWCFVLSNHSFVHNFLSYREFAIAFYGGVGFFVNFYRK